MTRGSRVGIDVGGTFTDFVLASGATGTLTYHKQASTTQNPAVGVAEGLRALLEKADAAADAVEVVVHGTTLALNAVLQRRGARVALVISRGFRHTMVLGRGGLPNSYNYKHPKQEPLIATEMVFEVDARLDADGQVLARPDDVAVRTLAQGIRAADADAVVVLIVNAYAYPDLEAALADSLAENLPGLLITRSSALWPEIREFERAMVCALNAFIHPLMDRYYGDLAAHLSDIGVAAPIYIATSNGGTVSVDTARQRPVDTLLSGPASGVVAAAQISQFADEQRIVTLDMGGTSSDIAVTRDGSPEYTTETRIGDLPLVLPVVNVRAIGAGGGSIVWIDDQGVLKVGPESAGAEPGPVAYGRGGTQPTITDCYLVAGILAPDRFLGGRMPLDAKAAHAALDAVGARLNIGQPDRAAKAAEAALRVATAQMATEISKNMAERGFDVRAFTLVPFGGAGPTHATLLASAAGLKRILVPQAPGTLCALGGIMADIRRDFVRSRRTSLVQDANAVDDLRSAVGELRDEAAAWIQAEDTVLEAPRFEISGDMQYPRTAFELNTPIPEELARTGSAEDIAERFHRQHEQLYGFRDENSAVDITTVRLRVIAPVPKVDFVTISRGSSGPEATGQRQVFSKGRWITAQVYSRGTLQAGSTIAGPAVIEQEDTTTWLTPEWQVVVDDVGSLHATPATAVSDE